ncbi:MAG: hypothetical protein AAFX94_00440 [Myxococcota bacterium]
MRLPRHLRPWSGLLEGLAPEVALALGDWLPRMDAALGPSRQTPQYTGEVEGYAGLVRRGSYERLLLSEWALADEVPEEFLRRAVSGEHSFLELAYQIPKESGQLYALFDCGPRQLGAPRLVHLAAMLVLLRRARDNGGELLIAPLQDPSQLQEVLSVQGAVEALLRWRTLHAPSAEAMSHWEEFFADPGDASVWLFAEKGFPGSNSVSVGLPDREGRIAVAVHRDREPKRELSLALPDARCCRQVLRNPFDIRTAATRHGLAIDSSQGLFISRQGTRLMVHLTDGRWAAVHVPNSPRERQGKTRYARQQPGQSLAALGWNRKRMIHVLRGDDFLLVAGVRIDLSADGPMNDGGEVSEVHRDRNGCYAFVSAEHDLYVIDRMSFGREASDVHALGVIDGDFVWAQADAFVRRRSYDGKLNHVHDALRADRTVGVGLRYFFVHHEDERRVEFVTTEGVSTHVLHHPAGTRLAGALDRGERPALVITEEDSCAISILRREHADSLPRTDSPIVAVDVDPRSNRIAYRTLDGVVRVYFADTCEMVLEIHPDEATE